MAFCLSTWKWGGSAGLFVGAMVLCAHAQSGGEQSIRFEPSLDSGTPDSSAPEVIKQPGSSGLVDSTKPLDLSLAPHSAFNHGPAADYDVMPVTPATIIKSQNKPVEWTLMTPEEILNMPTPEKIFGLPDPDADKTPEERYLERVQEAAAAGTNGSARFRLGDNGLDDTPFGSASRNSMDAAQSERTDPTKVFSSFAEPAANSPFNANPSQKPDSPWSSAFSSPTQSPKPDPEQVADMERFRVLLLGSTPPPAVNSAASVNPVASSSSLAGLQQGSFSSFSEQDLLNHSTREADLDKLSQLKTLTEPMGYYHPPAKKSTSEAQLPPWLSSGVPAKPAGWNF